MQRQLLDGQQIAAAKLIERPHLAREISGTFLDNSAGGLFDRLLLC